MGGVPLLASLMSQEAVRTDSYTLVCICAVVTNISTDRDNSLAFRGANGIFLLGKVLEEHPWGDAGSNPHQIVVRCAPSVKHHRPPGTRLTAARARARR